MTAIASRAAYAGAPTTDRHWAPKPSGEADPAAHLTPAQIDALGRELDAIREEILAARGAADAAYIRRLITIQRSLELVSRLLLLRSKHWPLWVAGTAGLSVAKILENMEIGHNVMHGQWDWMRDPAIHSRTWEWDHACPSAMWKHTHNDLHHTYTNVIEMDSDLGYGLLRVDKDQPWEPRFVLQPLWNLINGLLFQYSIAFYDLNVAELVEAKPEVEAKATAAPAKGVARVRDDHANLRAVGRKIGRQAARDYLIHPALSGSSWASTLAANAVANLIRNVWEHAVIICGHFPEGVQTFAKESVESESRGEWYLRQGLGSANIDGGPLLHVMTGNLSHQIEHHMFPDLPSNRYAEVAPQVRAIMAEHGLPYATGSFGRQLTSVWRNCWYYSLPDGAWEQLRAAPVATARRGLRALRRPGVAKATFLRRRLPAT